MMAVNRDDNQKADYLLLKVDGVVYSVKRNTDGSLIYMSRDKFLKLTKEKIHEQT